VCVKSRHTTSNEQGDAELTHVFTPHIDTLRRTVSWK